MNFKNIDLEDHDGPAMCPACDKLFRFCGCTEYPYYISEDCKCEDCDEKPFLEDPNIHCDQVIFSRKIQKPRKYKTGNYGKLKHFERKRKQREHTLKRKNLVKSKKQREKKIEAPEEDFNVYDSWEMEFPERIPNIFRTCYIYNAHIRFFEEMIEYYCNRSGVIIDGNLILY